jgi:hypothetical protein
MTQPTTAGLETSTDTPTETPKSRGQTSVFQHVDEAPFFPVRLLTDHVINTQDAALQVRVLDQPTHGNSNHVYEFYVEPNQHNERGYKATIHFQNGPILEYGVNGVTNESLLAVVADRLRGFQSGQFACRENDKALAHIEEAIHWLQQRTIQRQRRGVEGLNLV